MTDHDLCRALQNAFWLTAEGLMFRHINPWELDAALVAWGYGMGPCEAQDHVGLERVLARHPDRPVPILPRMVAEGRMGKIGGAGYYRYPGGGGAVIDPLIEDLIREEAWFAKMTRAERDDAFVVTEMNAALAAVLRRSPASKGALLDVLEQAVHFPPDRLRDLG